jgi:hypothetical protein
MHQWALFPILVAVTLLAPAVARVAATAELSADIGQRLLKAYPEQLVRIDGNELIWKDGTSTQLDDGKGDKSFDAWLEHPDVADMFAQPYPAGTAAVPPGKDDDPGRARNAAFFDKVYGNCRAGEVEKNLTRVTWLPTKRKQRLAFSKVNGAARALQAVSAELDALPASFDIYLYPSAGTYNCRVIAGTSRVSAHGHGIAIDIALPRAHYWRNAAPAKDGGIAYRNEIPMEIDRIFEKHGFIWGGRWYHYDTMHFEYRPELVGNGAGR